MNLVKILNSSFDYSREKIEKELIERADTVYPDTHSIEDWLNDAKEVPEWANRAAAKCVIQLWMKERDTCEAHGLLAVDKKYTGYLQGFTLGEIVGMQQDIVAQD